jgi:hypothetical protein
MQTSVFYPSAQSYASILSTLGGVCITILVLIFSLNRKTRAENRRIKTFLICALILATFACFTGAHLLVDILSFGETPDEFLRFYRIAVINVYIAMIYFSFALGLLTWLFEDQVDLKNIGEFSSFAMIAIAFLFCFANVLSQQTRSLSTQWAWTLLIIFCILGIIIAFGLSRLEKVDDFLFTPFWLAFAAVAGSGAYYGLRLAIPFSQMVDHIIFLFFTIFPILLCLV